MVVCLCIPSLLLSLPAHSQGLPVPVRVGVKGGFASADLQSDRFGGSQRRSGFTGGLLALVNPSGDFGLQAEVLYTQKGDESELPVQDGGNLQFDTVTLKLDYVEVPVLARLQAPLLGSAFLSPYGGPVFAFKVNEDNGDLGLADFEGTPEDVELASSTDFGVAFGAAFGIDGEIGRLVVDARLVAGLSDIGNETVQVRDGRITRTIGLTGASNRAFTVTVGWLFR